MAAVSVLAQVQVEDRSINTSGNYQQHPGGYANAPQGGNVADMHYQLQVLQQEVQQLRGLVEEQAHELKKLKQQRLDDYVELDRRLSGARGNMQQPMPPVAEGRMPGQPHSQVGGDPSYGGNIQPAPPMQQRPDELQIYRQAIDLVLKQRNYDRAIVELDGYLQNFPNGRYAANAQYWLGEIYLLKNSLDLSREWFSRLLTEHPTHAKAPDAKYKLGKVYDLLGDKATAKALLQEVASSNSNAAKLAREYLSANFSS